MEKTMSPAHKIMKAVAKYASKPKTKGEKQLPGSKASKSVEKAKA